MNESRRKVVAMWQVLHRRLQVPPARTGPSTKSECHPILLQPAAARRFGLRYSGLRAWMKYIGVKMPSWPASAMATAQRFKFSDTRSVPFGTMWSASRTRSEL